MMHLSLAFGGDYNVVLLEFKFIELDDVYATGSSMPQKKTPILPSLFGESGRVYGIYCYADGDEGPALAYNKDMQEDKEPVSIP